METKILRPTIANIRLCAQEIKAGGIVAFPTETVYGLGANAFDPQAAKKIYEAKGRPSDNPLIVHIYKLEQLSELAAEISDVARELASRFMPGPLTLVFKKKESVPDAVTGGLDTVGVRLPVHPVAKLLLHSCGVPVCAPSANASTRPSPTRAEHVYADLKGKIPYILDGGSCEVGLESTIVDVSCPKPRILRLGGIAAEEIEKITGPIEIVRSSEKALCPGMKYKHYAPKAEVFFSAYYDKMSETVCEKYDSLTDLGKNPVILCLDGNAGKYAPRNVIKTGKTYADYAHNLFAALRSADEMKYDSVIAEGVDSAGIGAAIINRLVKSSGGQII